MLGRALTRSPDAASVPAVGASGSLLGSWGSEVSTPKSSSHTLIRADEKLTGFNGCAKEPAGNVEPSRNVGHTAKPLKGRLKRWKGSDRAVTEFSIKAYSRYRFGSL